MYVVHFCRCTIDGCDQSFKAKQNLKRHEQRVHINKDYKVGRNRKSMMFRDSWRQPYVTLSLLSTANATLPCRQQAAPGGQNVFGGLRLVNTIAAGTRPISLPCPREYVVIVY